MSFKKFSKSIFKRPNALIAFAMYSLLLGLIGYQSGKTPEIISVLLIIFSIGLNFLNNYIDKQVKDEFERSNIKAENETGNTISKQKFDFVSIVHEKISINNILIRELLGKNDVTDDLRQKLKNNFQNIQVSHQALNHLIFTYKKDKKGNNVEILKIIVSIAVEDRLRYKNRDDFNLKSKYIYVYLKGWLTCSIKYETDKLPIEWIKQTDVKKEELVNAISYIRKLVIHDSRVKENIQSEECRKLIAKYIDILVKKIKEYQVSLPIS